jgi:glycine cleavage system H protein
MNYPNNLKYTSDHVWVKVEGDKVIVGITDFAQDQLGDVLYVDLPAEGDSFAKGEVFSEVESSKNGFRTALSVRGRSNESKRRPG